MLRPLVSVFTLLIFLAPSGASAETPAPETLEFTPKDGRIKVGRGQKGDTLKLHLYDNSPGLITDPKHLTSDVNSPGWVPGKDGVGVQRIWWKAIGTDCQPCGLLVANFNSVMDDLLWVRYARKEAQFQNTAFTKQMRAKMSPSSRSADPKTAEAESAQQLGSLVDVGDRFGQIDKYLAAQEKLLTAQAQELRRAIAECEKQCKGKVTKTSGIALGGLPALSGAGTPSPGSATSFPKLPFDWKGPYPSVCPKCAKLAAELNKIREWARRLQLTRAAYERDLKLAEMRWNLVKASYHYGYAYAPEDVQQVINSTKQALETVDQYFKVLTRHFKLTLAKYNDCVKTCKPDSRQASLAAPGSSAPASSAGSEAVRTQPAAQSTTPVAAATTPGSTPAASTPNLTASDNPDYKGWYTYRNELRPATWIDFTTPCLQCKPLARSYNQVMRQLFRARHQLKLLTYYRDEVRGRMAQARADAAKGQSSQSQGIGGRSDSAAAGALNFQAGILDLNDNLGPQLRRLIASLEVQAATLRGQIKACEKECEAEIAFDSKLVAGQPVSAPLLQPPFTWQGPYAEGCPKCAKLAERLNELQRLAQQTMGELAAAKASKQLAESELQIHRTLDSQTGPQKRPYAQPVNAASANEIDLDPATRKRRISHLEGEIRSAEANIRRLESNLQKIKQNFDATLALYNECLKTCKTRTALLAPAAPADSVATGNDATPVCYEGGQSYEAISIGPNETYGSGAEIKETASSLFGGGAGLGSLGGGGSTLGGKPKGTGTFSESATRGGNKEPETVDDPTSGRFTALSGGGVDMDLRANMTGDGLLVSANLTDAPGDGTFHAMWLEDDAGRVVLPNRYLMFSMYREWRLTVWWTYDRWVDGEHVEHREGGWSESWREERDGLLALYGGEEGVENAIWNRLGFDRPVRGVQHLGALFPVTAADLTGPCPLRLVTHVSLPETDPVRTQPLVSDLSGVAANDNTETVAAVNVRQMSDF
jgi:hypothetical protein